jgi:hypothetical protein
MIVARDMPVSLGQLTYIIKVDAVTEEAGSITSYFYNCTSMT